MSVLGEGGAGVAYWLSTRLYDRKAGGSIPHSTTAGDGLCLTVGAVKIYLKRWGRILNRTQFLGGVYKP